MWQNPSMAVDPYDHTVGMNPHNAEKGTGVVRIPCNPMPADKDRPDLTLVCPIAGTVEPPLVVEPGTPDAGAPDAPTQPPGELDAATVTPPDAAAAAGGSAGTPGAGGSPGTGGTVSTPGTGGSPGTGGATPVADLAEKDSGCTFAPGRGRGSAFALAGVAMVVALCRRRRRRA
jgi:hypothetical protein